ncbi:hypothetical protein [Planctomicrobium piriforme]|uniref:Uncharacterized protein n=1 Tax=Planctomicrobium piriforme TaxID=1576369 RepID=A0A1I3ML68_9PLAN|nr:hypothetical protein [Planctomicrobium piriforme]SFI97757.1 hypothetical protein SAMN05421753_11441 [Planctomicrobium piriforme]
MNVQRTFANPVALLVVGLFACGGLCGCQSNIGGQTLPSAYYLRDDVQFFPAGPEFLLPQTVKAHEDYRAAQALAAESNAPVP